MNIVEALNKIEQNPDFTTWYHEIKKMKESGYNFQYTQINRYKKGLSKPSYRVVSMFKNLYSIAIDDFYVPQGRQIVK